VDNQTELFEVLSARGFITTKDPNVFIAERVADLRNLKGYLFTSTALHIFAVTNRCNLNCVYCQAKSPDSKLDGVMDVETGKKAIEVAMQSPSKNLTFEFQGGEPLANFEVLKHIILYTEEKKGSKSITFSLVSNLTLLTEEKLAFLMEHNVGISTSLDGFEMLHNKNRPFSNGAGTYKIVEEKIKFIQDHQYGVGAIQTTTRQSLQHPKEIINTYVSLQQTNIFIRPLTCLGTAARVWDEIGYTAEEFLAFYEECLRYIIQLNLSGTEIQENHAAIFLKKILAGVAVNYMELRSPCGASVGQMAYFYDGNVFTCDEGRMFYEMGMDDFRIGDVYENTYDEMMQSTGCKAVCVASLLEGQIKCCDCVYQPYCGTCPVINLTQEKDLFVKNTQSFRCKIYGGILDIIFKILKNGSQEEISVFKKWVGVSCNE
jgi:His-Xaa-Ser system radical SAM maturase HxsB